MVCYHPLQGYRALQANEGGKRPIVFSRRAGFEDRPVSVPCGQCIGCRLERSRVWAIRCVHEASLYDANCFLTLTYNDANLPEHGSLVKAHFQNFMKRLRDRTRYKGADGVNGIRYYMCGEYGENFGRPHYHACLFNWNFEDRVVWRKSPSGEILYRSESLEGLWPCGFSSIGNVTFESAAYVARYVMKKINGKAAVAHYNKWDPETGEILSERVPEYTEMSRAGGVGKGWYLKFAGDLYPGDFVVHENKRGRVPRFYDNMYEVDDPVAFRIIKGVRVRRAKAHSENNTPDRRRVRETVQLGKLKQLKREIE